LPRHRGRFLAEDVGKELDMVLDTIFERSVDEHAPACLPS